MCPSLNLAELYRSPATRDPASRVKSAEESEKTSHNYELTRRSCVKFNDPRIGANLRVVGCDASAFSAAVRDVFLGLRGQSFITSFSFAAAMSLTLPSLFLVRSWI